VNLFNSPISKFNKSTSALNFINCCSAVKDPDAVFDAAEGVVVDDDEDVEFEASRTGELMIPARVGCILRIRATDDSACDTRLVSSSPFI
jgi:hypothetical protein